MTVWKYPLNVADDNNLLMPAGAVPIHVAEQYGSPCLWALVDETAPTTMRRFRLAGTGHPIEHAPAALAHIGTFLVEGGSLVFHLFEILTAAD